MRRWLRRTLSTIWIKIRRRNQGQTFADGLRAIEGFWGSIISHGPEIAVPQEVLFKKGEGYAPWPLAVAKFDDEVASALLTLKERGFIVFLIVNVEEGDFFDAGAFAVAKWLQTQGALGLFDKATSWKRACRYFGRENLQSKESLICLANELTEIGQEPAGESR